MLKWHIIVTDHHQKETPTVGAVKCPLKIKKEATSFPEINFNLNKTASIIIIISNWNNYITPTASV